MPSAIVTGAAGGMGQAISGALVAAGVRVVGVDRTTPEGVEVVVGDELVGERHLRAPRGPRLVHDRLVGDRAVEVAVRVVGGLVALALGAFRETHPEPGPLHLGHVADQAEQGHRGRLDRAAGQLLGVKPRALQLQGEALAAEKLGQGRPLAS